MRDPLKMFTVIDNNAGHPILKINIFKRITKNTQGFPEMEGSSQFTAADFVRSVNKKVTARLVCLYSSSLTSTCYPTSHGLFLLMSEPDPSFFFSGFHQGTDYSEKSRILANVIVQAKTLRTH